MPSAARCASRLAGQRIARRSAGTLPLQSSLGRTRSLNGRFARPAAVSGFICPRGALSSALGRLTFGRRRKIDAGLTGFRQADCNCLFGRPRTVLTFANVMNFLAHELAGLRRWALPGSLIRTRAVNGALRRHIVSPQERWLRRLRYEMTNPECRRKPRARRGRLARHLHAVIFNVNGGGRDDSKAQFRRISAVLTPSRSKNRSATEPGDFQDASGCRKARTCCAIFQTAGMTSRCRSSKPARPEFCSGTLRAWRRSERSRGSSKAVVEIRRSRQG
jgi:hypothetical protein